MKISQSKKKLVNGLSQALVPGELVLSVCLKSSHPKIVFMLPILTRLPIQFLLTINNWLGPSNVLALFMVRNFILFYH